MFDEMRGFFRGPYRMFGSIQQILAIIAKLLALPGFKTDKVGLRLFLLGSGDVAVELADLTPNTEVDDQIADAFLVLINNDTAYDIIYALAQLVLNDDDNEVEVEEAAVAACDSIRDSKMVSMSPLLIMAVIRMILMVLRLRKGA